MNDSLAAHLLIAAIVYITIKRKKLTVAGSLSGGVIAALLFAGLGWTGMGLLGAFFVPAVAATSWKARAKAPLALADDLHGTRDIYQVLANGAAAAIIAIPAIWQPGYTAICGLLVASSLSAALADTLSSELGSLYGSRFFNVLTFRPDKRGENGVISIVGTIIGIGGSLLMAFVYMMFTEIKWAPLIIIAIAGTVGNLADSVLGATLERKGLINNNTVNVINTIVGAVTAAVICFLME